MTQEQIDNNRSAFIQELRETKIEGINTMIGIMDRYRLFTRKCKRHDETEGGLANYLLWALKFARESAVTMRKEFPELELPEESVTMQCLCEGICFHDEPKVKEKKDLTLARQVMAKVPFSPLSRQLITDAKRVSIGFCDCIPFGTEQRKPVKAKKEDCYEEVCMDEVEHRMWMGSDEFEAKFPVHVIMSVPVNIKGKGKDVLVAYDDNKMFSLLFMTEEGGRGKKPVYASDKAMFGYTDLEFYITRYPLYRSCYIAARNAKGMWGLLRVRENRKDHGDKILVEKVVDFNWRTSDKVLDHLMGHTGFPISIKHPDFYTMIPLEL